MSQGLAGVLDEHGLARPAPARDGVARVAPAHRRGGRSPRLSTEPRRRRFGERQKPQRRRDRAVDHQLLLLSATIEEMADGLSAEGYQLMLGNSRYSEATEEGLVASFMAWSPRRHRADREPPLAPDARHAAQCRVAGDRDVGGASSARSIRRSGSRNRAVGQAIARHFIVGGARGTSPFIGAALDQDYRSAERGEGFAAAAAAAGLPEIVRLGAARACEHGGRRRRVLPN